MDAIVDGARVTGHRRIPVIRHAAVVGAAADDRV
jgi:hypothetical protein